jgi:hypothetical protein
MLLYYIMNALEHFEEWLPGELIYSGTKQGGAYNTRLERAKRGTGDRSMYSFLSDEWSMAQDQLKRGFIHAPDHRKSAQLQQAKFASGLFDKAATANWLLAGKPSAPAAMAKVAHHTAQEILEIRPWEQVRTAAFYPEIEVVQPFKNTLFRGGILALQLNFVNATNELRPTKRSELLEVTKTNAIMLGGMAALCYEAFANAHLSPDQYLLAPSQHAVDLQ